MEPAPLGMNVPLEGTRKLAGGRAPASDDPSPAHPAPAGGAAATGSREIGRSPDAQGLRCWWAHAQAAAEVRSPQALGVTGVMAVGAPGRSAHPVCPSSAAFSARAGTTRSVTAARSVTVAIRTGGTFSAVAIALFTLAGCGVVSGWFGDDEPKPQAVSVFQVSVGQCFATPEKVQQELADIQSVPCDGPHRQEAYAVVDYQAPTGVQGDAYPGDSALAAYADAACAQSFQEYVGISYLDSTLFFTYLLPSARSWQESGDRSVICFATTTGAELSSTVKGTKW